MQSARVLGCGGSVRTSTAALPGLVAARFAFAGFGMLSGFLEDGDHALGGQRGHHHQAAGAGFEADFGFRISGAQGLGHGLLALLGGGWGVVGHRASCGGRGAHARVAGL